MRNIRLVLSLLLAAAALPSLRAQQQRVSPHETIGAVIGDRHTGNRVTITYGRPYSKDPHTGEIRRIWGALVPWGEPYRLGADEATLLTVTQPLSVGGTTVPAGAYSLYLVPSEKGATQLGIGTAVGRWGVPVDTGHDLARVEMKREELPAQVDQLTLSLDKDGASGLILSVAWEKTRFTVALAAPQPRLEFPQASPSAVLRQRVGLTDIEVAYSRPSAKGRTMLGGNNPYGQVWRTGANAATRVTFSTEVVFGDAKVPAGTYELFSIPGKDQWVFMLQKAHNQWGAYSYDAKEDVARATAVPAVLAKPVETLTIEFNNLRDESASLDLSWETTQVSVPIHVDVVSAMVPKIEAAMAASGRKPYMQAALFYMDHNLDLDKALGWLNTAIAEQPDAFYLTYNKARVLAKKGDKAGALAAAKESLEGASKNTGPEGIEYTRLNEALIAGLK